MVIRFHKKALIHFLLIYFMILVNQSCLYALFLYSLPGQLAIFLVYTGLILLKRDWIYTKYFLLAGVLLVTTAITRYAAGGFGLHSWLNWVVPILVTAYTVNYNIDEFPHRFVKVAAFLAGLSLILFLIQQAAPGMLMALIPTRYTTEFSDKIWLNAYYYKEVFDKGYGLFLYSLNDSPAMLGRNKSIFTEPGACQMLFNSAVFVMLFLPEKLRLSRKQYQRTLLILIVSVLSTLSTTGYLALGVTLTAYFLVQPDHMTRVKGNLLILVMLLLAALGVDYVLRGRDSFWYVSIIKKFFNDHGRLELNNSAFSRVAVASVALDAMLRHPLGIGWERMGYLIAHKKGADGGAGILQFGATAGILPFLLCVLFHVLPVARCTMKRPAKWALLFMFVNTLLAQTYPFYPLLILFPVYLMDVRRESREAVSGMSGSR